MAWSDVRGPDIELPARGPTGAAGVNGVFSNVRLAKTGAYTAANADKGKTIALGGSAFYALTFSAASGYDSDYINLVINEDTASAKTISLAGTLHRLYPAQWAWVSNQNNVWKISKPNRYKLTTPGNFYISPSGHDTNNDGLSVGSPFLTIQAAFNHVIDNFDISGQHDFTFWLADGTYTAGVHYSAVITGGEGGAQVILTGTNATGAIISTTSADAIAAFVNAVLQVRNVKLQTTTGGTCIKAGLGSIIYVLANVEFGACAGDHMNAADPGSLIQLISNYVVSGGAAVAHMTAQTLGSIKGTGIARTVTTNVTFTYTALTSTAGVIVDSGGSWSLGAFSVTGQRYSATANSVIFTGGGGSYYPGSSAGVTGTGGQYI